MGSKTPPELAEQLYADYLITDNYSETARKFNIHRRTVYEVVNRLGGDELAQHRTAIREDICTEASKGILVLIRDIQGGAEPPTGLDAAKAAESLSRVISNLTPKDKDADAPPPTIIVNTHCKPPAEVLARQQQASTTTTTLDTPISDPTPESATHPKKV